MGHNVLLSWNPFAIVALSLITLKSRVQYESSFKLLHERDSKIEALVLLLSYTITSLTKRIWRGNLPESL